ncbi:MAG: 4Fe-4S dicluster domain-containing protein [Candidatus Marinimicrobia bacterium]|nr:4Fe-4S dicluster domain-containing protein [Candidatus Neomarinimicrobiota bacterium]
MQKNLKRIRIFLSTIIFLSFLSIFTFSNIPDKLGKILTNFQFTPVLLTLISSLALSAVIIFIILILASLIFGRIYCASFCPLGILQDIIIYLGEKLHLQPKKSPQKPLTILRLSILFVTLATVVFGTNLLLNIIEPYSLFGRFSVSIFRPLYAFVNNQLVTILENFNIYSISYINYPDTSIFLSIITLVIFFGLVILTLLRGRKYCNSICPVGTILSILSKPAIFRIAITEQECTNCKICESECRAGCIDIEKSSIDHTRCTLCFDCVGACPQGAIAYRPIKNSVTSSNPNRRSFITGSLALLALPIIQDSKKDTAKNTPVLPPGANNYESFLNKCTGCHLCVNACPSQVIVPSLFDYGLEGIFQSKMDYNQGYCNYDCNTCTQICPTEALSELNLEEKQLTKLGEVNLNKDQCIVYRTNADCGACIEHCPTHAVYADERNGIRYPETNPDYCIGCGACQYPCPTTPRAITVTALTNHTKALPPFQETQESEKSKEKSDTDESDTDFPF